jgi:hypothetical protein
MGTMIVFPLTEDMFEINQKSQIHFSANFLTCVVKQETSTPGFKTINPIQISKGEYEIKVTGRATRNNVFFIWVFDVENEYNLSGVVHLNEKRHTHRVKFSIDSETYIKIGILSHQQKINDTCDIEHIELADVSKENNTKPLFLKKNQNSILTNHLDHWNVRANQENSTPGCKLDVNVEEGKCYAISVDIEVQSKNAACFLWAYSSELKRDIIPRVNVFQGGDCTTRTDRVVYLQIPEKTKQITIGILFSSSGLDRNDEFNVYQLQIEEIIQINQIIDSSYVLNLDDEIKKFEYCEWALAKEGVNANRLIAIRGAEEPHISNFKKYQKLPMTSEDERLGRKAIQSAGAWGYLLTMKKIFEDAISNNYDIIAVFDDDIILCHDFTLKFSRFYRGVPDHWEILMLGSSQWDWTNIHLDEFEFMYRPNISSNGSFAMLYHHSIFQELIQQIEKMDSPFDSNPLKSITANSFRASSFVAFPNLIIADVEKSGIRDSRSQEAYSKRFRWDLSKYHNNYKRWRKNSVLLREDTPDGWKSKSKIHMMLAITTINRWDYLEECIQTFISTKSDDYFWTLIIADDGSSDDTVKKMLDYKIHDTKIVLLQNNGSGIAVQTNSIFNYIEHLNDKPKIIFSIDDDIFFKKNGWDKRYHEAIERTGFDHLVHFNSDWKAPLHNKSLTKNGIQLNSQTDGKNCMGCFYTITPRLLDKIGWFDNIAFPIRGHSHIDFTMRSCKAGFNKNDSLYDISNASDYIGIHPKEGYVSTHKKYSIVEQLILADEQDKQNRWDLIDNTNRILIPKEIFDFEIPDQDYYDNLLSLCFSSKLIPLNKEMSNTVQETFTIKEIPNPHQDNVPQIENNSYYPKEKWKQQGNRLSLTYKELEIWFEMPLDWSMEETHPDLFKLAEFVLLSPFEPDILEGWMPSRKPGIRPGLAFSGGIDSTASMCLMPDRTLLFYHERAGFESILNHENADLFIKHLEQKEGRPVVRVRSNHELIRTLSGKTPGFITDYACAVHVILLADYYQLDSIGTGMPLENSFFFHGQKFRNFQSSAFWKKHSTLFDSVGLSIYQPVMGCSEPMNQVIVDAFGYENLAQSCLRSNGGSICGKCWKCFRKNTLVGKPFEMSHEISTFLAKQPLKMAASTIYSLQKMEQGPQLDSILQNYPHIKELMQKDVSFLEQYYTPALQLLPSKYRSYTESILRNLVPMMESFDLINLFSLD